MVVKDAIQGPGCLRSIPRNLQFSFCGWSCHTCRAKQNVLCLKILEWYLKKHGTQHLSFKTIFSSVAAKVVALPAQA